uniref:Uncharacterized protein n=1 Tax=Romanomermis culicivorax TaxID=13658 RepID=A0A915ICN6_ROMCU
MKNSTYYLVISLEAKSTSVGSANQSRDDVKLDTMSISCSSRGSLKNEETDSHRLARRFAFEKGVLSESKIVRYLCNDGPVVLDEDRSTSILGIAKFAFSFGKRLQHRYKSNIIFVIRITPPRGEEFRIFCIAAAMATVFLFKSTPNTLALNRARKLAGSLTVCVRARAVIAGNVDDGSDDS